MRKMLYRATLVGFALYAAVVCGSCSKQDSMMLGRASFSEDASAPMLDAMKDAAPSPSGSADQSGVAKARSDGASTAPESAGRKLVYRADMSVEADDPFAAESVVLSAAKAVGGYAAVRNADQYSVYLELRVPVSSLEGLMNALAGTGKTLSRSVSAEDVTDRYFDIEGRLRNKRLLEERYREYLKKASSVEDMLAVEARLSETTNDIEQLTGSFKDLSDRIELATLSVSIQAVRVDDPSKPNLGESLSDLFAGVGDALRVAVVVLVGLVVYGVPAVLAVAALWWLSFGKLGLVRKLFSMIRAHPAKNGLKGE